MQIEPNTTNDSKKKQEKSLFSDTPDRPEGLFDRLTYISSTTNEMNYPNSHNKESKYLLPKRGFLPQEKETTDLTQFNVVEHPYITMSTKGKTHIRSQFYQKVHSSEVKLFFYCLTNGAHGLFINCDFIQIIENTDNKVYFNVGYPTRETYPPNGYYEKGSNPIIDKYYSVIKNQEDRLCKGEHSTLINNRDFVINARVKKDKLKNVKLIAYYLNFGLVQVIIFDFNNNTTVNALLDFEEKEVGWHISDKIYKHSLSHFKRLENYKLRKYARLIMGFDFVMMKIAAAID